MYEENRRFSWTNLFIKIIIVIIFILFTVWLISLSTKGITMGMSNSLDVLTDNIFSQNVEKMKEVGKSYFTTERLPKKIGEVKTLSLAKMYDENLILEIKDKNGNVCSAKNSYVAVEKMENEYQMKVYLECGEESDFIKVIMGCYNYCNTDICERNKDIEEANNKLLEYQYSKTSGGSWSPYGNWSEWSKTVVTKNNYRDVETKTVKEEYSYNKNITDSKYVGLANCPYVEGYSFVTSDNGVCSYSKIITDVKDASKCPEKSGEYDLVSQDGFTCNYSKGGIATTKPLSCPETDGDYNLVSQDNFTCHYSKSVKGTTNPVACAKKDGEYDLVSQDGFTCNYSKSKTETINANKSGGDAIYGQSCSIVGYDTVRPCGTCGVQNVPIYSCGSVVTGYTPVTYSCPKEYTLSGSTCSRQVFENKQTTVGCPSGYTKTNNTCVANTATVSKKTTTVNCPKDYSKVNNTCQKSTVVKKTETASCPNGYEKRGNTCAKDITYTLDKNAVCAAGQRMQNGNCYKDETRIQTITGVRNVTYYRYRLREYVGGTTDYKWSQSNNDKDLISAGYKLTGKTRELGGK